MRKRTWTDARLKAGFDQFLAENHRLPRAHEIDDLTNLPSARTIQKYYGGLRTLRQRLGYEETDFGCGTQRSVVTQLVGVRGRQLEQELESQLHERFGSSCVQTEKIFLDRSRVDFYVVTNTGAFGVDIFFPATIRTMQNIINIKMKKYQFFNEPLYLVVANPAIKQVHLNHYARRRKQPFNDNTKLVTLIKFKRILSQYESINT